MNTKLGKCLSSEFQTPTFFHVPSVFVAHFWFSQRWFLKFKIFYSFLQKCLLFLLIETGCNQPLNIENIEIKKPEVFTHQSSSSNFAKPIYSYRTEQARFISCIHLKYAPNIENQEAGLSEYDRLRNKRAGACHPLTYHCIYHVIF